MILYSGKGKSKIKPWIPPGAGRPLEQHRTAAGVTVVGHGPQRLLKVLQVRQLEFLTQGPTKDTVTAARHGAALTGPLENTHSGSSN